MKYEIQNSMFYGKKRVHVYIYKHDKDAIFHAVYHGTHAKVGFSDLHKNFIEIYDGDNYIGAIYNINKKKIKWVNKQ